MDLAISSLKKKGQCANKDKYILFPFSILIPSTPSWYSRTSLADVLTVILVLMLYNKITCANMCAHCVCVSEWERECIEHWHVYLKSFSLNSSFFIFGSIINITKTVNWYRFQTCNLANSILQRDNARIRENTSCSKYNFTFWNMIYFLDCSQAITIDKYFKWEK